MEDLKLRQDSKNIKKEESFGIKNYKSLSLILVILLIFSLTGNIILISKLEPNKNLARILGRVVKSDNSNFSKEKIVSAKEIYPLFLCPCCGETIDANCCPMSKERKEYVDFLVRETKTRDEIILAYVKRYGLSSFKDKKEMEEFKNKLEKEAPVEKPIITISPSSYDFGDISQAKGVVSVSFEIRNKGQKDLVIERLETSCGCTSASIIYQGKENPVFTMPGHGKDNPTGWTGVAIAPGDKAELKVYYDPDVHKDFRGAATREVYIYSNDPINFETRVKIDLNQVN